MSSRDRPPGADEGQPTSPFDLDRRERALHPKLVHRTGVQSVQPRVWAPPQALTGRTPGATIQSRLISLEVGRHRPERDTNAVPLGAQPQRDLADRYETERDLQVAGIEGRA